MTPTPSTEHPHPDTLNLAVGALASTVAAQTALIDRLTTPEPSGLQRFAEILQPHAVQLGALLGQALVQRTQPPPLEGAYDGPRERQVRAEYHAQQARLDHELAEKRAQLVADFGPRFVEARRADDLDAEAFARMPDCQPPAHAAEHGVNGAAS